MINANEELLASDMVPSPIRVRVMQTQKRSKREECIHQSSHSFRHDDLKLSAYVQK